jgi:ATP-binding cassette, subfamily B, beta-glucan exporter
MSFLQIYRRVLAMLAPEKRLATTLAVANLALASAAFAGPLLFGRIIDTLANSASRPAEDTWQRTLVLLGIWGLIGIGSIAAGILVALHADRLAHRRRLAAIATYFEHVLRLPYAFHGSTHSSRQLKIMLHGSDTLFGLWLAFFREHQATLTALLALLPFTLLFNWRLGSLLVVMLFATAFLTWFVIRRTQTVQSTVEAQQSALVEQAGDALGNVLLVQSFVRLAAETRRLRSLMDRMLAAQFPVLNWWALVTVLSGAAATITLIAIFALGTWLHLHGKASVGEIVTFMGFATQLLGRLDQAMRFFNRLFFQAPKLAEFFKVLDTRSSMQDEPGAVSLPRVEGRIEFEQVSLSYGGERPAVHDLTFTALPGQTVALVGHTGAGKSTAVGLLQRLRDPDSGVIRIDGLDIRGVSLDSLRANIGVVFQESMLFYRSIADNLRVGRPAASDGELVEAAELAPGARLHPRAALPKAMRPWSASAAPRSRAASASGSRSPAPCSRTRRSWSSTRRRARSTLRPRPRSRRRCATSCAGAPRSSSRTGSRPCARRIRSWSSRAGGSSSAGPLPSCWPGAASSRASSPPSSAAGTPGPTPRSLPEASRARRPGGKRFLSLAGAGSAGW